MKLFVIGVLVFGLVIFPLVMRWAYPAGTVLVTPAAPMDPNLLVYVEAHRACCSR